MLRMSSGESEATNAAMTLLGRSAGLLSLPGWKFASCFARYSGIWPASFGFGGPVLLPSGPWQAAPTWLAVPAAPAAFAFLGGVAAGRGPAGDLGAGERRRGLQ